MTTNLIVDHAESYQEDISKKIPLKAGSGLIFKGLRPEDHAEYPVIIGKQYIKLLKIGPPATKPIDILLRRFGMIGNHEKHFITNTYDYAYSLKL